MDHVKGALEPLFSKVIELLELVNCKMQIDLNKEAESLEVEAEMESLKKELVSLQNKLQFMKTEGRYIDAVLSKLPSSRLEVKVWAEVRELSYDVEDVVDNFLVCLQGSEPTPEIDTLKKLVHKMADLDLWEKIPVDVKVRTDATIQDVAVRPASTMTIDPSFQAMYTQVQDLAGMRWNMDCLMDMISGNKVLSKECSSVQEPTETSDKVLSKDPAWTIPVNSQYKEEDMPSKTKPKIACVVGSGGLGKTTLVRALYDKIKKDYSCKAFVSVGRNANEKKVLVDILLALDEEKKEKKYTMDSLTGFDEGRLLKELEGFLFTKRYLIVIDDIWKEKDWNFIQCAFPNERYLGSQVITTTRSIYIANACCSSSDGHVIYQMKPLSDEDSKSLFYKRVFSQEGGECRDGFKQVSAAILKKCGGVPLAIITIASLLASNGEGIKPIDEWNHVLRSIGRGLTEDHSVQEMNRILSIGYDDLPPELKNCLLYTTVFPEDRQIKKGRLVSKWIAEGFVKLTDQEDSLFDVAENYFHMLINRSMIEPVNIDGEGKAKACRVHDMVLGFLCSLSSEANFITVIDGRNQTTSNAETTIRRLSLQASMAMAPVVTPQLSAASLGMAHVRSFTLSTISEGVFNLVPPHSTFPILRVLDLLDVHLGWAFNLCDHVHIKSLLHMRYLGLSMACITVLPGDLGKLKFLQILELRSLLYELPSSIVELRQLICLRVHPSTRLPHEFGKLTSLERLTHVLVKQNSAYVAKQLGYLTKLRVLRITPSDLDESLAEEFVESLNKLLEIRSLKLEDFSDVYDINVGDINVGECIRRMEESWKPSSHLQKFQLEDGYSFSLLPKWIIESSNISTLSICLKKVGRNDIEILGRLQYLRYLNLREEGWNNKYIGKQEEGIMFQCDAFPVARAFRVTGFVLLPSMFPKGAMPKVQILEFHVRLEDLGNMNLEMGHLPALKIVRVVIWCLTDYQNVMNGFHVLLREQMEYATALLRAAVDSHPSRPTIDIVEMYGYWHGVADNHKIKPKLYNWMWTNDDDEDQEDEDEQDEYASQTRFFDAEAVDVQTSHPPLHLTETGEASGFSSLPLLNPAFSTEEEQSPETDAGEWSMPAKRKGRSGADTCEDPSI